MNVRVTTLRARTHMGVTAGDCDPHFGTFFDSEATCLMAHNNVRPEVRVTGHDVYTCQT